MIRHDLRAGTIWEGDWLQAPLEPGYTMSEVDGPYALGKAAWDKMGVDGLADWYRPHLERLTGLMAPSSSVYLWNTAEGWARLDPEMRRLGWEFRSLIVWDKMNTAASMAWQKSNKWPVTHEVCGFYVCGGPFFSATDARSVWSLAIQGWAEERVVTGTNRPGAKNQNGVGCTVSDALHPCQKPLLFAERMVQASTRPGDRVLVPFGGTCRIATYLERLRRMEPENARYHDSCELNSDGKDYLSAVLGRMGEDTGKAGQMSLFGAR